MRLIIFLALLCGFYFVAYIYCNTKAKEKKNTALRRYEILIFYWGGKCDCPSYLSKPFDVEGMAENMLKMLESDKKLEKFGQQSLKIARSHEISKCKDRLVQVYERMMK